MTVQNGARTAGDMPALRLAKRLFLMTAGMTAMVAGAQPAMAQASPQAPATVDETAPAQGTTATPEGGPLKSSPAPGETVNDAAGKPQPESTGLVTQDAQPAAAAVATQSGDIVVTGTRIARSGYNAPTPVSVVTSKEINAEAPANIADFTNTLPSVRGSSTAANSSGSLSNGLAGIASVNLRSLGANRTLVLFDGQRSVASATSGVVDVNTFPQALIERVEVVTGGASSAYGSDAVSGVINFILNRNFKGVKAEYNYGVTTFGDGPNHKISLTAGVPFADDRGHLLVSGEWFTQDGKHTIDRDWNQSGFFQIDNPYYTATNGQPARLVSSGIGTSQFTPGGLIYSGPLAGNYFGTINPTTGKASVNQLNFGAVNGQWMVGGDYLITREGHVSSNTLIPDEDRKSAFARLSWEFSPAFNVYGQFAYSRYTGLSYYQQTPSTGVVIQKDNAFLPASIVAAMTANNLSSITIGTSNAGIPAAGSDNKREVYRYVAGADGEFDLLGSQWKWGGYYQKGIAKVHEELINTWSNAKMAFAQDAVVAQAGNAGGIAAGTITCRALTSSSAATRTAAAGCVPIDRIGIGGITPAALNYIFNDYNQPLRTQSLKQSVASINFSTNNLFENWAGPVSIAFGGEYRKESVSGDVDPQFQPLINANGTTTSQWLYGNYLPTFGHYNVKEAYVETVFPLFKGADLNGAARVTDYSTSGRVETWKLGLTYQVIPDIKFRGTLSRDIRAPNLSELFAAATGRTNTVNVPIAGGGQRVDQFLEATVGNPDLKPEIAKTYGLGVVLTPRFLRGFAASVDYYDIKLKGAISNYTAQTTVQLCYEQANQDACNNITTTLGTGVTTAGAQITGIKLIPFNFVGIKTRGIDFEASYRSRVGPGTMTLRALATHYISLYTDNGVDFPTEAAGQNTGNTPDWTYRFTAGYDIDKVSVELVARGLSSGVYDNSFIECQSSCPASTVQHRTINDNHIDGAIYFDLNFNYGFQIRGLKSEAFLAIRNVLNTDPVLVGNGPTGNNTPAYPQTNRNLYDVLGRVFRLGMRVAF